MNELYYVIRREYLTKVRTKSFIFITLLIPVLLILLFLLPRYFARQNENYKNIKVGLIDHFGSFNDVFNKSNLTIDLFSSQVMRGVLEEKSNRIVELIITSISPVKFMAGKIIGIVLLGLTQIICWLIIMYGFTLWLSNFSDLSSTDSIGKIINQNFNQDDITQIFNQLNLIDFNIIIPSFVFFFIGGYLLYSSVFAAIGATANHNDEIQQMTMIVTLPLVFSVIVLSSTINAPDSMLSYWCSIIPFTSPIIMMRRIVCGAPIQYSFNNSCQQNSNARYRFFYVSI